MDSSVIKSFLVGLGFGVDDTSLKKFNRAIADATLKVAALYAGIQLLAGVIAKSISGISADFEQMGYEYRIIAPAINKALMLRNALLSAYRAAGINIVKAVQQSVKFNFSLAKTKFALEAIYKSVGLKFLPLLTKQMDLFRTKIYQNMPKIQAALEHFIAFIFKAFDATVILGNRVWSILERVYDFFVALDKATDGWSTIILAVVAAWKFLNLAFLATPLGLLITGLTTLLALWDDFKTFREGGQALINWGSDFTKVIVGLIALIGTVTTAYYAWGVATSFLSNILKVYNAVLAVTDGLMVVLEAPVWAIVAAVTALVAALTLADQKWNILGGHLSGFFSGIGSRIMDFAGGGGIGAGAQLGKGSPLGSNVAAQQQTNQNVQQQTQINVMGAADANAVGVAVAGQQNRVNFDLTRNLKGATR